MNDANKPKDPIAELMSAAITAGADVIESTKTVALAIVPAIGYTIAGVIVMWGVKSVSIDLIDIIDRAIDIKKN